MECLGCSEVLFWLRIIAFWLGVRSGLLVASFVLWLTLFFLYDYYSFSLPSFITLFYYISVSTTSQRMTLWRTIRIMQLHLDEREKIETETWDFNCYSDLNWNRDWDWHWHWESDWESDTETENKLINFRIVPTHSLWT